MQLTLVSQFTRRFKRVLTRLERARPGSVLVLVIALLVLMALIGTAFISTAHIERYSATQNTYNTQLDLFSQGVNDLAEAAMLRKIQPSGAPFRQGTSSTATATSAYSPWESPVTDLYLADRTPPPLFYTLPTNNYPGVTPIDPAAIGAPANQAYFPPWMYITAPLNATAATPSGQFEAPYAVDWNGSPVQSPVTYIQYSGTTREQALPWAIPVPQPDGTTKMFPAFVGFPVNPTLMLADGKTPAKLPIIALAADTDGDGIADAGFIRLGGGQTEGATYYGAVRIVDNLAAFNASIGMGINPYPTKGKSVPGDFFPTNINLQGMANDSMAKLNAYRFNNGAGNNGVNFNARPIDDRGTAHADLTFATPYEALWTQLGCRLNNPGYNANTGNKYQALPVSEGMNLAYHFCLANQSIASTSPSLLETFLPNSTKGPGSNHAPYSPGNLALLVPGTVQLRPERQCQHATAGGHGRPQSGVEFHAVVVQRPGHLRQSTAGRRERIQLRRPGPVPRHDHRANARLRLHPASYRRQPVPDEWDGVQQRLLGGHALDHHPTTINANTGTFGQLWTAYWSVMQDSPDANGTYPGIAANQVDLPAPNNQFRNPIRTANATPLTRSQVIQLRSALAAVNTIDMRDGDTDVTSRTIKLVDTAASHPVYATVYGAERQPYFRAADRLRARPGQALRGHRAV